MTDEASGSMVGLGTPIMYVRMMQDLVCSCTRLVASAGKAISAHIEHNRYTERWLTCLEQTLLLHEYAPSTVRKYCACVAMFVREERWSRPSDLAQSHVQRHLDRLRAAGLGNGSLRLHLCAIRTVFDKILGHSITEGIKYASRPPRRPVATREQVAALLEKCRTDEQKLIVLLLNRGRFLPGKMTTLALSPAEQSSAQGLGESCVRVGKGKTNCMFTLKPRSRTAVKGRFAWLFPSPVNSGPVSLRTLQRRISALAETAGMELTCTAIRLASETPCLQIA